MQRISEPSPNEPRHLIPDLIACLDVQYHLGSACSAAVLFSHWQDTEPLAIHTAISHGYGDYQPGKFFERELGPLVKLVEMLPQCPSILVIDAYCTVSPEGAPGLGAYLWEKLAPKPIIIGVAKNRFAKASHAREIRRGQSSRPLFVTAIGMSVDEAAEHVIAMHGDYRLPSLIKRADQAARAGHGLESAGDLEPLTATSGDT